MACFTASSGAPDRAYKLPAWLEERCEVVEMLEDAGCEQTGWPLDPAEQDLWVPLRPVVVHRGLSEAMGSIVHSQAVVRGWIGWLEYVTNISGIVCIQALAWRWSAQHVAWQKRRQRCGWQLSLELVALVRVYTV
jgi:hypothetical protein